MSEGQIHLHSQEAFLDLLSGADLSQRPEEKKTPEEHSATAEHFYREAMQHKKESREAEYSTLLQKEKTERERLIRERGRVTESHYQEMCRSVSDGTEHLIPEIDEFLQLKERSDRATLERMHEEWEEKVHGSIQKQIREGLEANPIEEVEQRKREAFEEFLQHANTKAGMFRDIIIESEYNPLKLRDYSIRYSLNDGDDPTLRPLMKGYREQKTLESGPLRDGGGLAAASSASSAGSSSSAAGEGKSTKLPKDMSTGRDTFDVRKWSSVEATPYGRYNKMLEATGNPRNAQSQKSSISFDHFSFPVGNEFAKAEMPKGKKVFPDWEPSDK